MALVLAQWLRARGTAQQAVIRARDARQAATPATSRHAALQKRVQFVANGTAGTERKGGSWREKGGGGGVRAASLRWDTRCTTQQLKLYRNRLCNSPGKRRSCNHSGVTSVSTLIPVISRITPSFSSVNCQSRQTFRVECSAPKSRDPSSPICCRPGICTPTWRRRL